jgi:hypothetical protein
LDAIVRQLQGARPLVGGIGYGIATLDDYKSVPLHPEEERATCGMFPGRRREFWMGRSAAHRALVDLGAADSPVLAARRRPVFPAGLTGSISHSAGAAVAIVASADRFGSLGIDLELNPLPESASALVLGSEELERFTDGQCSCTEAFAAKEAVYKALDPLLDGGAPPLRRIALHPVEGGFEARLSQWPCVPAFVSIRRVGIGILAWTAIRSSQRGAD